MATHEELSALFSQAAAAAQAGRWPAAAQICDRILEAAPQHPETLHLRGIADLQEGRYGDALTRFDAAVALKPDFTAAHINRAAACLGLGRYREAEISSGRALTLNPAALNALNNRAAALNRLGQYGEALAMADRALALDAASGQALVARAEALAGLGQKDAALAAGEAALAGTADAEACCARANMLLELQRYAEALESADKAAALDPHLSAAHTARAAALNALGRTKEAIAAADRALAGDAESAQAFLARGAANIVLNKTEMALLDLDAALSIAPETELISGTSVFLALRAAQWDGLSDRISDLIARLEAGEIASSPYYLLAVPLSAEQLFRYTSAYFKRKLAQADTPTPGRRTPGPIRIGYFSADFYNHAVWFLVKGMLRLHDRSRFEIVAFDSGGKRENAMRGDAMKCVDRYVDIEGRSNDEIVALVRDMGIDIAVDLTVHSGAGRHPEFFARRIAPVQVNFLGYPATSGGACYDYIISDAVVSPPQDRPWHSEKIVAMPDTYYPTDYHACGALPAYTRRELGLPENAFVFCCFNDGFKLTPDVFDIWMRLLKAVDGSVLWLLESSASTMANLRSEARDRGVAGERLIFAPRMSIVNHLGRHRAADLFLDTGPYNAHTTACDALWGGVPLVTWLGATFAARVAGSVLTAAGFPELVTESLAAYESLALTLARDPERLSALRRRLESERTNCRLFDTPRYTRHFDRAMAAIWQRHEKGLAPDHIIVPADATP